MPAAALLLALGAAFLHALWNVLLRRARDVEAATAVGFTAAVVLFAPAAAATWRVDAGAIPYVVASGSLELAYLVLLAAAYRRLELSVVYPVARGAAPLLVLLGTAVVLGRGTSAGQAVGVVAVAAGIVVVRGLRRDAGGIAAGLAIALLIASYTLVDKAGLRHASPLAYLELVLGVPSFTYLAILWRLRGRRALAAEVRWSTLAVGLGSLGAFALALAALRLASAPSVSAVRETSIVIATVLAALVLKEPVGPRRLAGSAIVAGGVALLALT